MQRNPDTYLSNLESVFKWISAQCNWQEGGKMLLNAFNKAIFWYALNKLSWQVHDIQAEAPPRSNMPLSCRSVHSLFWNINGDFFIWIYRCSFNDFKVYMFKHHTFLCSCTSMSKEQRSSTLYLKIIPCDHVKNTSELTSKQKPKYMNIMLLLENPREGSQLPLLW